MALKRQTQVPVVMAMFLAIMATAVAMAGEGTAAGKGPGPVKPELPPDPAVMKILDALGENQSALLPPLKTHGEFSADQKQWRHDKVGPTRRDYCLKWVWEADRGRAAFCGGNAGVPHKLNDVWEYDLASNTWVLLWEPDPDTNRVRHMKPEEAKAYLDSFVTVDKETGEIMTKRGAPFDPVHTWWGLTYDPELHAVLWVMGNHHLHDKFMGMHPELQADYKLGGFHKMRMWAYYPYEHRWQFMPVPADMPELHKTGAAILEYIPELKGSLWYASTFMQTAVFRSNDRSWGSFTKLAPNSQTWAKMTDFPAMEAVAAYDSASKVLVACRGGDKVRDALIPTKTYHYHPETNKWEKVGEIEAGPAAADNKTGMTYDSATGQCYIVGNGELWSYRVADRKWQKLVPDGPPAPSRFQLLSCYNPRFNVLMADAGSGQIWVYRGRKAKDARQ